MMLSGCKKQDGNHKDRKKGLERTEGMRGRERDSYYTVRGEKESNALDVQGVVVAWEKENYV